MPTRERKRNRFPAEILPKDLRCLGPSPASDPVGPTSLSLSQMPTHLSDREKETERQREMEKYGRRRKSKASHIIQDTRNKTPDLGLRDG